MLSPPPQQKFADKVLGVLRDPSQLPPEFASWVRGQIVRNPTVKLDSYQLPTPDKKHLIGATGEPVFANGWLAYGSTYDAPSYWKDLSGVIHLQGMLKSGTLAAAAFTLPVSYRPTADLVFAVFSNSAFGWVNVRSTGDVQPNGSNVSVSLSGISFRP